MRIWEKALDYKRKVLVTKTGTEFARASIASIAMKVSFAFTGFATTVVLARTLGVDSFGVYSFVLTLITLIALPAKAGLPQVVVRETARSLATENWRALKGAWIWATKFVMKFSFALMIAGSITAYLLRDNFTQEQVLTFIVGLAVVPLFALGELRSASLRGLGKVVKGQLPDMILRPSLQLLILLTVVHFLGSSLNAVGAMGVYAAACLGAFMAGAVLLLKARPDQVREVQAQYESKKWGGAALPMATTNALHLANTQIDFLLIGIFLSSADVGLYRVAVQASLLVVFGLQASKMVVEPHFSRLYAKGEIAKLQHLLTRVSQLNLAVAAAVLFILAVFGSYLLTAAFGSSFEASFFPMLLLAGGRLISATIGSSGHLLNMAGFERPYARIWFGCALLNIAMNLILIPKFGITGAAFSTGFTVLLANCISWRLAKKVTGCDASPFVRV